MVEDVGGFDRELKLHAFVDRDVLAQRCGEDGGSGADDAADAGGAEVAAVVGGDGEGVRVEPLVHVAVGGVEVLAGDDVGAGLADGGEDVGVGRVRGGLVGREERAALEDGDAAEMPVADEAVQCPGVRQEALAVAKGKIVEIGDEEAVLAVVADVAVVEAGVEAVSDEVPA